MLAKTKWSPCGILKKEKKYVMIMLSQKPTNISRSIVYVDVHFVEKMWLETTGNSLNSKKSMADILCRISWTWLTGKINSYRCLIDINSNETINYNIFCFFEWYINLPLTRPTNIPTKIEPKIPNDDSNESLGGISSCCIPHSRSQSSGIDSRVYSTNSVNVQTSPQPGSSIPSPL